MVERSHSNTPHDFIIYWPLLTTSNGMQQEAEEYVMGEEGGSNDNKQIDDVIDDCCHPLSTIEDKGVEVRGVKWQFTRFLWFFLCIQFVGAVDG